MDAHAARELLVHVAEAQRALEPLGVGVAHPGRRAAQRDLADDVTGADRPHAADGALHLAALGRVVRRDRDPLQHLAAPRDDVDRDHVRDIAAAISATSCSASRTRSERASVALTRATRLRARVRGLDLAPRGALGDQQALALQRRAAALGDVAPEHDELHAALGAQRTRRDLDRDDRAVGPRHLGLEAGPRHAPGDHVGDERAQLVTAPARDELQPGGQRAQLVDAAPGEPLAASLA